MIQVNALTFQKCLHFLIVTLSPIDRVLAAIAFVRGPRYDELRSGDNLKRVRYRLMGANHEHVIDGTVRFVYSPSP